MSKPIYIFSGFLDSGKSTTIKETLYDRDFNEGEKTLLVCFETGDVTYDEKFLSYTNCVVEYLDSLKDLTIEKQKELDKKHKPDRIFLELNGMENDRDLFAQGFCRNWEVAQVLTLIDASTFKMYVTNMRQFIFNHVYNADLCILNRSDDADKKYLRNNLKAINPRLEILFEDRAGNVTASSKEELFDLSKKLDLEDCDYGMWYIDCVDDPFKYDGKAISFNLRLVEPIKEYEEVAVMGRPAMVCCSNDIQDIGITCIGVDWLNMKKGDFYHISGTLKCIEDQNGGATCVCYADSCEKTEGPEDPLVYFN